MIVLPLTFQGLALVADLELLTIKIQQMTIENTNDNKPTTPAITYSECYQQCFCSDNLELMKTIESNTIDLIYCDLLYGTGRNFADYQDLKPIRSEKEVKYYELAVGRVFGQHCH